MEATLFEDYELGGRRDEFRDGEHTPNQTPMTRPEGSSGSILSGKVGMQRRSRQGLQYPCPSLAKLVIASPIM